MPARVDAEGGLLAVMFVDLDRFGQPIGIEVLRPAREWPLQEILRRWSIDPNAGQLLRSMFGPDAALKTFPFARDCMALVPT